MYVCVPLNIILFPYANQFENIETSKFGEFISPTKVALVCLKFILSFIKFCSFATKLLANLWILNQGQ